MMKIFNVYEIVQYIGQDILVPDTLSTALIANRANLTTYEYHAYPGIAINDVQMLREWRKKYIRLNDIMPPNRTKNAIQKIQGKLRSNNLLHLDDWRSSFFKPELGPYIPLNNVNDAKTVVNNYMRVHYPSTDQVAFSNAAKENNIPKTKLRKAIENKQIEALSINGRLYINSSQLTNEIKKEKAMIRFENMLERYALDYHLRMTAKTVSHILQMMIENDFFGISYKNERKVLTASNQGNSYWIHDTPQAYNIIVGLMRSNCQKMIRKENLEYFLALISDRPNTKKVYHAFLDNEKIKLNRMYDNTELMQILSFLVLIPCEIMDADDDIINDMLEYIMNRNKKAYRDIYNFIVYAALTTDCMYQASNIYYMKQPVEKRDVEPYPAELYMRIAYLTFNSMFINNNRSISKAIDNSEYAQVWLFVAMHYFAMWRRGDILDVPMPYLEEDINNIINKLQNDVIDNDFYARICDSIVLQVSSMVTNKTGESLVLDIPIDMVDIVGKLILICEYHRQREGRSRLIELNAITSVSNYIGIFGNEYANTLGEKLFSNRKANKSYATAIAMRIETAVGKSQKIMGYMIASYARSHKGNIDSIAPTTMHYLEYKSDGLSVDQFLMEIFSTGTCGFMLDVLLDWVVPSYNELNPHNQSILCQMLGLTAYDIDRRISGLTSLEYTSKQYLEECIGNITSEEDIKSRVAELMDNIANHNYIAKERHVTCLRAAAYQECVNENADYCIDCKYALYHRMYIYELSKRMQEYDTLIKKLKDKLVIEKNKMILNTLKNIYREMRRELIRRYDYKAGLLNNIVMGGELNDTGE